LVPVQRDPSRVREIGPKLSLAKVGHRETAKFHVGIKVYRVKNLNVAEGGIRKKMGGGGNLRKNHATNRKTVSHVFWRKISGAKAYGGKRKMYLYGDRHRPR